jgi:hypothetical protein
VSPVFRKKRRLAAVIIRFSGPLDAAQATSVTEYRLATAGKKGSFDAKNARVIPLKSAIYDGATFAVTLIPAKAYALRKPVAVRVGGRAPSGIHDAFGRLITSGPGGPPTTEAHALLSRGHRRSRLRERS